MATEKKEQQRESGGAKTESLWRKPIALEPFEEDDPLARLYRGREAGIAPLAEAAPQTSLRIDASAPTKEQLNETAAAKPDKPKMKGVAKTTRLSEGETPQKKNSSTPPTSKITEAELKNLLKIKSDSYHFTDLREILRGKSFDIYAYLSLLSGGAGVCKIKHLDLMKKLDISRPTLFKQGEWLMRLSLIEKRNVPGDHLGTSYTVHRLEEVLPVPVNLVEQLELQIESWRQNIAEL